MTGLLDKAPQANSQENTSYSRPEAVRVSQVSQFAVNIPSAVEYDTENRVPPNKANVSNPWMPLMQEQAVATSWFLLDALDSQVPLVWAQYKAATGQLGMNAEPVLTLERYRRVLFELLAWSCFVLRASAIPSRITRRTARTLWLKSEADEETGNQFFELLLTDMANYLSPYLSSMGDLEVVSFQPFQVGCGAPLSLENRVAEYLNADSYVMSRELFGQHMALALGAEAHQVAHAQAFSHSLVTALSASPDVILAQVLDDPHPVGQIEALLEADIHEVIDATAPLRQQIRRAVLEGLQLPQFQRQFAP